MKKKAQKHPLPPLTQAGFTLIELMVVVVIVAVMLSAVTFSVSTSDGAKLRKQEAAMKGVITALCDRATFQQKLYLAMPEEKGLSFAKYEREQWVEVSRIEQAPWEAGVEVKWSLDAEAAKQSGLPKPGWVCWPSGEVSAGDIIFRVDKNQTILSWDELGRFKTEYESEDE